MKYLSDFDGFLMWRDEPQVVFSIRNNSVSSVEVIGENLPVEFHAKLNDKEAIYEFLIDRETPETRHNIIADLKAVGIPYYDIVMMLRFNHGNTVNDDFWVKFSDEPDISFAEVKPFAVHHAFSNQ